MRPASSRSPGRHGSGEGDRLVVNLGATRRGPLLTRERTNMRGDERKHLPTSVRLGRSTTWLLVAMGVLGGCGGGFSGPSGGDVVDASSDGSGDESPIIGLSPDAASSGD